ncbi:MAG TPA: CHAT domain-containing tetratricopeptide repeat protein [Vicinamibacterales bacterium]|nr:CHAT domain-containing tetratricopeptide repeat protein [Vicinamibacterales bacterium]
MPAVDTAAARDEVLRLTDQVTAVVRADLPEARRLADAAAAIADRIDDDYCRARAARARGNVEHVAGHHEDSLRHYDRALAMFQSVGADLDAAVTHLSALVPLSYTSRYADAFARAAAARAVFERLNDRLRLARLDNNLAGIYYRQDRVEEARRHYESAIAVFDTHGTVLDRAITLRNMAVCYITLNDFERARDTYRQARDLCRANGLTRLVHENDYNIAYLHYLRGEYTRAIELYNATRLTCNQHDDDYHRALCDLDQAEMYLELNLTEDGEQLARSAFDAFDRLGMRYEAAKALALAAIGASQHRRPAQALQIFSEARARFVDERNAVWPGLIDLYGALVLLEESRLAEAQQGAEAALAAFAEPAFSPKAALAELLIARVRLASNDVAEADTFCRRAVARAEAIDSPGLHYHAHVVAGQIAEARGDRAAAFAAYTRAHAALERLRSHLAGDQLKVAFLQNRLVVFESLVDLLMNEPPTPERDARALAVIEEAKSRSLSDLISFRLQDLAPNSRGGSELVERIRRIREELNWYYHQLDLSQLRPRPASAQKLTELRSEATARERQLVSLLDDVRGADPEFHSLHHTAAIDLDAVRSSIPDDALVVEFFEARDVLYAAVLGRKRLDVRAVTSIGRVRHVVRLLDFQMSKFRLGADYVSRFELSLHTAALKHLQTLYAELIAPIRASLDAAHLIIVPHGALHCVPFHALHDGHEYLCDRFSISYAPSARVFHLCASKADSFDDSSIVLGVPDAVAPRIADEARAVADLLPNARLFMGSDVTEARLRDDARHSRFVHIAAHGYFRQDNPMFSSIRLGESQLTLFDLYRLRLSAELVTLSGCGTGLNVVVAGDEMLGLTRGLLYAGAHALLLTLWEVNDESTAAFMPLFYGELAGEPTNKAAALRRAMLAVRDAHPHPYYWAPFVMSGKYARQQVEPIQ